PFGVWDGGNAGRAARTADRRRRANVVRPLPVDPDSDECRSASIRDGAGSTRGVRYAGAGNFQTSASITRPRLGRHSPWRDPRRGRTRRDPRPAPTLPDPGRGRSPPDLGRDRSRPADVAAPGGPFRGCGDGTAARHAPYRGALELVWTDAQQSRRPGSIP